MGDRAFPVDGPLSIFGGYFRDIIWEEAGRTLASLGHQERVEGTKTI